MNVQQVVEESQHAYKGFLKEVRPPPKVVTAATDLRLMPVVPFFLSFSTRGLLTTEAKENKVFTHPYSYVYIFSDLQFLFPTRRASTNFIRHTFVIYLSQLC